MTYMLFVARHNQQVVSVVKERKLTLMSYTGSIRLCQKGGMQVQTQDSHFEHLSVCDEHTGQSRTSEGQIVQEMRTDRA